MRRPARVLLSLVSLMLPLLSPHQVASGRVPRAAAARVTGGAAERAVLLEVDAGDAPLGIFHGHLDIPVSPGPLSLVYPKWIPGEHGPTGPIAQMVNLQLRVAGKEVAWRRDAVDMFVFHCEIPPGARSLEVSLDYVSPFTTFNRGYGNSPNATAQLLIVLWNHLLLYPQGRAASDLVYRASVRLPAGWRYATALPIRSEGSRGVEFEPVSLATLVDSPLIAGRYFRSVELSAARDSSVQLDMVADSAPALNISPEVVAAYKRMVAEADALFGVRHYRRYHFLLTLSDAVTVNGMEHHESSDNRVAERTLVDELMFRRRATLLPHEYTHSWNGKYRRPEGLATPDYQQPMRGELLWIYEGLTRYLGDLVLTGRSGLRSAEQSREYLAWVAANLERNRPGRRWRSLADTAVAAQTIYTAPGEWAALRRGLDFYDEGLLIWLEADVIIRRQSGGRRTLGDFCRAFFGGPGGSPTVKPYALEEVLDGLKEVAAYDWRGFFDARLNSTGTAAPLGGLSGSGWRLVYTDTPNEYAQLLEQTNKIMDFSLSLGAWMRADGTVTDIIPDLPAHRAALLPGRKIVAVNGVPWSPQAMRGAVQASGPATARLELLVEGGGERTTLRLDYHGGERYPHLERDPASPDLLTRILAPLNASLPGEQRAHP